MLNIARVEIVKEEKIVVPEIKDTRGGIQRKIFEGKVFDLLWERRLV